MRRPLLLVALLALAAALTTLDLFGPDGQRIGQVREGPGNTVDVYDSQSRRVGWGRCDRIGTCQLFDMRGNRIVESRGGRIIIGPHLMR